MPDFSTEQLRRNQDVRVHYQPGGAGPSNPVYFLGSEDAQIGFITGATFTNDPIGDPLWVPGRRPGTWELKGRTRNPRDLPTISVEWHEWLNGGMPRALTRQQCPTTFYELSSRCADLSDHNRGWSGYVAVYADGVAGPADGGARNARTDDNPLTDSIEYTLRDAYLVGQLGYADEGATVVVQETIDGVYWGAGNCGDCGAANDGSRYSYYVTRANVGSPSAPGQLVYSTDYGVTWETSSITGIGSTNAPAGIDVVGSRLFVWVPAAPAIFYATLDPETGDPGAWATLTTGAYQDAWVQSGRSIWFCGASGIIHRTRDIAVAPTLVDNGASAVTLNRIHGAGQTIVSVGASGTVRASTDNGSSWTTYPVVVAGSTITTGMVGVWVWSAKRWHVLSTANVLYVTEDAGATWAIVPTPSTGTGTGRDIVFATPEVGYLSYDVSSTAYLACTIDGGATWASDGSRLLQYPTFERGNRVAVPQSGVADIDANTAGVAGLRGVGGDGVIMLGVASRV